MKVLVVNTGGTLSMKKVGKSYVNELNYLDTILDLLRERDQQERTSNLAAAQAEKGAADRMNTRQGSPHQMRDIYEKRNAQRVANERLDGCRRRNAKEFELASSQIDIVELDPVLDSSEMQPSDWSRIAKVIDENYHNYVGFVVLHGTDTMGFTASALTFLLTTAKPVILTGSQNPICPYPNGTVDPEALHNLISSCQFAKESIPEVLVFFYRKLMRGVRTTKISADSAEHAAFDCPKTMPVVEFREHSRILHRFDNTSHIETIRRTNEEKTFAASIPIINPYVVLVRLFPGIGANAIDLNARGIVIQAFGSGNGPISNPASPFRKAIKIAIQKGIVLCFVTECARGSVNEDYASSLGDQNEFPGIVPCSNMTAEAAFAKLCVGLSKFLTGKRKVFKVRSYMMNNEHGECDTDAV